MIIYFLLLMINLNLWHQRIERITYSKSFFTKKLYDYRCFHGRVISSKSSDLGSCHVKNNVYILFGAFLEELWENRPDRWNLSRTESLPIKMDSGSGSRVTKNINQKRLNVRNETTKESSCELNTENTPVNFSRSRDSRYRYGVAIILNEEVARAVTGFAPMAEKKLMLQLMTTYGKLKIIQMHALAEIKTK